MVQTGDTYKKRYKMRTAGEGGLNIVVSMPKNVIQKEADKRGISIEDFIENFQVVAQYNSFDGVLYTFEEAKGEVNESKEHNPME